MNPPAYDLDAMLNRLHLTTIRRLYAELVLRAEEEDMSYRTFLERGTHFVLRGASY